MAPLENGSFQQSVWEGDARRPIDSLMRALLYIAQQIGRPVSEADIRRLAAIPASGLDESAFLTAGRRLGLESYAVEFAGQRLDELPAANGPCSTSSKGASGIWRAMK